MLFRSYQTFVANHPTLSDRYGASVAVEGVEGRVFDASFTEVIIESEDGRFFAVDRAKVEDAFEVGHVLCVGIFGRASLVEADAVGGKPDRRDACRKS